MLFRTSSPATLCLWCLVAAAISRTMVVVVSASSNNHNNNIVTTADARLPMSLSTVVSDLEAEGCPSVSTACLITSASVGRKQRVQLLEQITGDDLSSEGQEDGEDDTDPTLWKALGTNSGFALTQPTSCEETASTSVACDGTILYYAHAVDLQRGEGLFDTLAPAMEQMLNSNKDNNNRHRALYVLVVDGDEETVRNRLEKAATPILSNLIADSNNNKPITTLDDVFDKVMYISPQSAASVVTSSKQTTPADVAAQVAELWITSQGLAFQWTSTTSSSDLTATDLAAARKLGPAARRKLSEAVAQVQQAVTDASDGSTKLVPNFGQLCDAAAKQAQESLLGTTDVASSKSSLMGKQIRANFLGDLDASFSDLFAEQLALLQQASFEEFKRNLSKLLVSPNLQKDMEAEAGKSVASFSSLAKKLIPKTAKSSSFYDTSATKIAYTRKLKDYIANRIQNARANNKFKPLPRKGVTVGLHWLLPKPFGNDYRQEPWMVHATDNMVYVPNSKLADVSPKDVASGDWRDKIVPSPAGNDMLYMQ